MSDKLCYRKYFTDIEKEEKWLNEMAENGLLLKKVKPEFLHCNYYFEKSTAKYTFRLDYSRDGAVMEEITAPYVMFVTSSCEAEYIGYYDGKVYFRKNSEKGEFPKLHSDPNSLYEQERKRFGQCLSIVMLFVFDIAYICFNVLPDIFSGKSVTVSTAAFVVCLLFCIAGIALTMRGTIAAKKKMNELKMLMGK